MLQGYDQVVNAANQDYEARDPSKRFWLNIGFGGYHIPESEGSSFSWKRRMARAVELCLAVLVATGTVLVHCRQGKHRSGAFASVVLAVLLDLPLDEAVKMYFQNRPLPLNRDQNIVWKIINNRGIREWLDGFRRHFHISALFEEAIEKKRKKTSEAARVQANKMPKKGSECSGVPRRSEVPPMPLQAQSAPALPPASISGVPRRSEVPPVPLQKKSAPALPPASISGVPRRSHVPPMTLQKKSAPALPSASISSVPRRSDVPPMPLQKKSAPALPSASISSVPRRSEVPPMPLQRKSAPALPPASSSEAPPWTAADRWREDVEDEEEDEDWWEDVEAEEVRDARLPEDGAWECPECASMNLRSTMRCPCGCLRPLVQDWRDGDWFCRDCGNHNFKWRKACANTYCLTMDVKPGDWVCIRCGNHNFSKNRFCNTKWCRKPKP